MAVFVEAFFTIDDDMSGVITSRDLQEYMTENNYDDSFVAKWLNLFDKDNTGTITLREFCEVLGLEHKKILEKQKKLHPDDLPDYVTVIKGEISLKYMIKISVYTKRLIDNETSGDEIVKQLKRFLDLRLGRLWHCIMVKGQYWAFYSTEPNMSFVFKIGGLIFLVWRTPA